ncbi:MAG: hypothetical protein M3P48_02990, partial [Actinomycetota bacterium]|nr:hypothetical protein [Actinomycetota bacterium]
MSGTGAHQREQGVHPQPVDPTLPRPIAPAGDARKLLRVVVDGAVELGDLVGPPVGVQRRHAVRLRPVADRPLLHRLGVPRLGTEWIGGEDGPGYGGPQLRARLLVHPRQHALLHGRRDLGVEVPDGVDHHAGLRERRPPLAERFQRRPARSAKEPSHVDPRLCGPRGQPERGSDLLARPVVLGRRLDPGNRDDGLLNLRLQPGPLRLPRPQDLDLLVTVEVLA